MLNDHIVTKAELLADGSDAITEVMLTIVKESNGMISLSCNDQVLMVKADAIRCVLG